MKNTSFKNVSTRLCNEPSSSRLRQNLQATLAQVPNMERILDGLRDLVQKMSMRMENLEKVSMVILNKVNNIESMLQNLTVPPTVVHGMDNVSNDKMDVTDDDGDEGRGDDDDENENCEHDEDEDSGDDEDEDRKVPHCVSSNPLFPSGGSEVLFKVEDNVARREDFDCLCPPNVIQPEIIEMVALKTTWVQKRTPTASIWSLPPSFADEVRQGCTIDDMVDAYAKDWMVPYIGLKYIYAPIQIVKGGHWFLMVVSIKDQKVYHIDSRLPVGVVTHRRGIIRKMCKMLTMMMMSEDYPYAHSYEDIEMGHWEICAIPNRGQSGNSAASVLQWMSMESAFQPNRSRVLDENTVRMKTALDLLIGRHNEYNNTVEAKAHAFWRNT